MTPADVRKPAPGRMIRRNLVAANILTARDDGRLPEWTIQLRPGDFAPGQKIHGTARHRAGKPRPIIIAADGSYASLPRELVGLLSAALTLSDSGQL